MTRLFTCLLCLVGLNIAALAQEAPKETTRAKKTAKTTKARANIQTRVRLRVVEKKEGPKQPAAKTPRVNVVVDRPTVLSGRIVREAAGPGFWIGVQLAPVPPAVRAQLGLGKEQGLMVESVIPQSPAATTLKPFDILVGVNGRPLASHEGLTKTVQAAGKTKKSLKLTIIRGGKKSTIEITPARPKQAERVIVIQGTRLEQAKDKLNGLRFEGNLNLEEIEKKIRILTDKDQRTFELRIESGEKNGKKGRFTRSIRISPEGVIVTPQQPSAQTEQAQTEQGQKAKPRFEYRIKRSNQAGEGESSAVLRKLDAVLQRIERLEATVKKLQK
jgi:membrane-associated protease RseP (regulator of RpoE activity)